MIKFTAPEDRIVRTFYGRVTDRVTDDEKRILTLLLEDPAYTYTSLSEKFGLSPDEIPDSVEEQSHLEDNTYHLKILQQMDKNNELHYLLFLYQ